MKKVRILPTTQGPGPKFKILLVEPHVVVRQGLAGLLNQEPDLIVCGGVSESAAAIKSIIDLRPDLAIIDITLKKGNGLELIKHITAQYPKLPVLVLSMHEELLFAEVALRSGAIGYIMKDQPIDKLLVAIRHVLHRELYVSEGVTRQMLRQQIGGQKKSIAAPAESLSDRELQVFQLLSEWKGTRDISKELHISVKTVEYHFRKIKEKLRLTSGKDLLHYATALAAPDPAVASGGERKRPRTAAR